jgi:hypothetical protein
MRLLQNWLFLEAEMKGLCIVLQLIVSLVVIENTNGISSPLPPFTTYKHSTELQANTADLWWTVDADEREIIFELHIKTTGWIALGISPGRFLFRTRSQTLPHCLSVFSGWHERCRYRCGMGRSGGQCAFSSNKGSSILHCMICVFISRIAMHSTIHDLSSTLQRVIGLLFEVVKRADGQPFSSNVYWTLVTPWTFQSR